VTIPADPHYTPSRHAYLATREEAKGVAEIGEMILVNRHWHSGVDDAVQAETHIDDQDWAQDTIDAISTVGARVADGIKRSSIIMNRSVLLRCINGDAATKARLLAAAGEVDAALLVVTEGLDNDPDSTALQEMQRALADLG
jgi:hypothetical protein